MSPQDERIWQSLVAATEAYSSSSRAFLEEATDRVGLLRRSLGGNVVNVILALASLPYVPLSDRLELFDLIIEKCTVQKYASLAKRLVLSLPRDWVIANIENATKPLLGQFDHIDYLLLLDLYASLDKHLAIKLAHAAAAHPNIEVRDVGEQYITQLFAVRSESFRTTE
jgi:hypothetical protein